MNLTHAFHASARFGMGARPGELKHIASDPRGWIYEQINFNIIPPEVTQRYGQQEVNQAIARSGRMREKEPIKETEINSWRIFNLETADRIASQVNSTQPCAERMVNFWSNHFTISSRKDNLHTEANRYEVEAIRPHIGGYFKDMLKAVIRHPAMLIYLDNVESIGRKSVAARRNRRGLNENLAREIMELHTMGVGSGYTQQDVIELAKMITGWSVDRPWDEPMPQYQFFPDRHEPGRKTLLGKEFRETGIEEGDQALDFLAKQPATARFIATKLARHYINDTPNPRDIEYIASAFAGSDGHLPTVMNAVSSLDSAWIPLTKIKNPYDYIISALRAAETTMSGREIMRTLKTLNYEMFNATSPAGHPDTSVAWSSPDAIMKRVEWAHNASRRLTSNKAPIDIAQAVIGPVMSERTKFEINAAPSGRDGLTLLFASPEFQRR